MVSALLSQLLPLKLGMPLVAGIDRGAAEHGNQQHTPRLRPEVGEDGCSCPQVLQGTSQEVALRGQQTSAPLKQGIL